MIKKWSKACLPLFVFVVFLAMGLTSLTAQDKETKLKQAKPVKSDAKKVSVPF